MGVIAPKRRRGRTYFGCSAAACLGLIFGAIIACCLAFTVTRLSTELNSGGPELVSAFYAISRIMVGSLVFCGFGIFQQTRPFSARMDPHDLNTVVLFFFLFTAGMILAAALPTLVLEVPGMSAWFIAGGILMGSAFLLYGMLMLWLTLAAYESFWEAGL